MEADIDDTVLMRRVAGGDDDAFTAVIEKYQKSVFGYFYRMGCDPQRSEDFAQETFIRLYHHAANYCPRAKLLTYILTIARNFLIDYWRQRKVAETAINDDGDVAETRATPDYLANRQELRQNVDAALRALPESQREAIVLAVVEDLSQDTVAEIMKIPVGTVKSRIFYGLKTLREELNKLGYHCGDL